MTAPAQNETPETVAAIDLGSNSFHMIVARLEPAGTLAIIDRLRDSVRLGGGLSKKNRLKKAAQERAFHCLQSFAQRVRDLPDNAVRIAGTNTLRVATNAAEFVARAEAILQHPIEIIEGREEARLIYLGVAHGLAAGDEKRLVVDIGGGSTECIIGRGMQPLQRESLFTGCVQASKRFFADGEISKAAMKAARLDARLVFLPVADAFRRGNWEQAIGCAGTIRAIRNILHEEGLCDSGIERGALEKLAKKLLAAGHPDRLKLAGLSQSRRPVLAGGLSVLLGVFDSLDIDHMQVSDQSMREGLLYDLVGRIRHQDVRDASVTAAIQRWDVDAAQAGRVAQTARTLCRQACAQWGFDDETLVRLLEWAARLHEIGLGVSHNNYHKHGAYILQHADMAGFSRQEQAFLATLVLNHRSKFRVDTFDTLMQPFVKPGRRLCILLRLAVLIHRGRSDTQCPELTLTVRGKRIHLHFPAAWLQQHSLTLADLERERERLKAAGYTLSFD